MKLVKIRFTPWRDQSSEPRSPAVQQLLDALITRMSLLSAAAARIKDEQILVDSEMLQKSLARINSELQTIEAERTLLLFAEKAEAEAAKRAASEYAKVGTFGYQVWNDAGTRLTKLVDEAGNDLPEKAVYSYEVVDDDPPLPEWAENGKLAKGKA